MAGKGLHLHSVRAVSVLLLVAAGLLLAASSAARADDPVVARTANLTERQVDTGAGALRIASASVRQDRLNDRAQATVTLDAAPDASTPGTLIVAFGPIRQGICELNDFLDADEYRTPTVGSLAPGWSQNGRTFRLDLEDDAAGYQPWQCAGAILVSGDEIVSFLGGDLTDIYMKPDLRIQKPQILQRTVKGKLKLVRGATHAIRIPVKSLNEVRARGVVVTGSGKGLKVGRTKEDSLIGNYTSTVRLTVRAVKRRVGPLKLRVTSVNGPTATRKVPVKLTKPPARPRPGAYRSKDGDVSFRITGGKKPKIKGFSIDTRTRCGGYGDFPTYTNNTYNFPNVAIGGGGIVDRSDQKPLYRVSLSLKAIGRRVTEGYFSYGNRAAPCSAIETFEARRVGR
jgi:hypothetical protein